MLTPDDIETIGDWLKGTTLPKLIAQIEERYTAHWKAAQTPAAREDCWQMIRCLTDVVDEMTRLTAAPKVAQHNAKLARTNNWKMPAPPPGDA